MPAGVFYNQAENIAVRFLRLSGFTVLSRNDRRFGAELDIICRACARNELAIFEVKELQPHSDYPAISVRQYRRILGAVAALESENDRRLPVTLHALLVNTRRQSICMVPLADYR